MSDPLAAPPPGRGPGPSGPGAPASPWAFAGMVGLAAVLFLDVASVTFLPGWAVVALVVVWVGLLVQGCRWFVRRPRGVAALAGVAFATWAVAWLAVVLG